MVTGSVARNDRAKIYRGVAACRALYTSRPYPQDEKWLTLRASPATKDWFTVGLPGRCLGSPRIHLRPAFRAPSEKDRSPRDRQRYARRETGSLGERKISVQWLATRDSLSAQSLAGIPRGPDRRGPIARPIPRIPKIARDTARTG